MLSRGLSRLYTRRSQGNGITQRAGGFVIKAESSGRLLSTIFRNKEERDSMAGKHAKSAFAQHLQGGVVWLPKKVKIMEMPGNRAEGGYGEIRRVRIAKMAGIPTDCDFTAKKSKAATPFLQRQAQSMEACVNPI